MAGRPQLPPVRGERRYSRHLPGDDTDVLRHGNSSSEKSPTANQTWSRIIVVTTVKYFWPDFCLAMITMYGQPWYPASGKLASCTLARPADIRRQVGEQKIQSRLGSRAIQASRRYRPLPAERPGCAGRLHGNPATKFPTISILYRLGPRAGFLSFTSTNACRFIWVQKPMAEYPQRT